MNVSALEARLTALEEALRRREKSPGRRKGFTNQRGAAEYLGCSREHLPHSPPTGQRSEADPRRQIRRAVTPPNAKRQPFEAGVCIFNGAAGCGGSVQQTNGHFSVQLRDAPPLRAHHQSGRDGCLAHLTAAAKRQGATDADLRYDSFQHQVTAPRAYPTHQGAGRPAAVRAFLRTHQP
jgi:hypothetical protein